MGYFQGKGLVSVTGKARVETEFVSSTFNVTVKQRGADGPAAKTLAIPIIEKVKNVAREYAQRAEIDTTRLKTTLKTEPTHDRHTGEPNGYECTYTMSFIGKNVNEATAVHDALTAIVGAHAGSPVFNVNDADEVQDKAFQIAVDAAKKKFERQCRAVGVEPSIYTISSWAPESENEHHGKMLSIREEDGPKPVGLEPGKATLDVKVTVWFIHRDCLGN